mmetsp:Transcript_43743/g.126370  ORF Transcript_43743/g.126370 Transcript_43743/m.126370 type:complete len:389 (+) Transcript_43743:94-1260(+)
MIVLRARADTTYVLSVTQNGCKNGGWVHMWEDGDLQEEYGQWELHDNGVLRSRADPRYALCVTQQGCQNGGWVHMWELGEQVADIYSQWIVHDGELRAKADPRYSLCVRRDGCTNGGYLHMWSFGGPPDIYGQWEIQEAELPACGRLPLTPQSNSSLDQDMPFSQEGGGLLEPAVRHFHEALILDTELDRVLDLRRSSLVSGLEALGQALNRVGGGMGSYLLSEVDKLRKSHAHRSEENYRPWLLGELSVHAATDYKCFVDDSACMANLGVARTLDFFVHFLSFLRDGLETSTSIDMAYRKTLQTHHDFFQRIAFTTAAMQLPSRQSTMRVLEGQARGVDASREIVALAAHCRRIVTFCAQLDKELQAALEERRGKLEMDQAYGRAGW